MGRHFAVGETPTRLALPGGRWHLGAEHSVVFVSIAERELLVSPGDPMTIDVRDGAVVTGYSSRPARLIAER